MASNDDSVPITQKESNPEINSQNKNSSEINSCDSTSNDSKSATLPSNYPSFSKLLEGVVMAANSALSSNSPVKTSGFQGQFGMSHQEVLANVTAKAAQAHPQMQPQTESKKSLIKPSSKRKVEKLEVKRGNSSYHTDEPPDDVPKTPQSDGYGWRKYGQKQVKSSGSFRSYYRCTHLSCSAKKKVQHLDVSGQVIDVVYKGDHNHDPPQNLKGSSRKKDSTPHSLNNSSDSCVQNVDAPQSLTCEEELKQLVPSTRECLDENLNCSAGTSPRNLEEKHTKSVNSTSRHENELVTVVSRSENSNEVAMIDPMKEPGVAPLKKRRIKERGKACSESVYRTFKDPKTVVHAAGDIAMSSDGYRWRKYGQKMVKGNPHPRSYYRCSSVGCPVRKHVERAIDNSATMIVTYEGKHDHDIPVPKRHHHASPNNSPVIETVNAAASGANMLLDKSEDKSRDSESDQGEEKSSEAGGDKVLESARTLLSIGIELKSC